MSYTREQRAANAAKAAERAAKGAGQRAGSSSTPADTDSRPDGWRPEPKNEPRRLAMEEIAARHEKTSGNAPQAEQVETVETTPPPEVVEAAPIAPERILETDAAMARRAVPEPVAEPKEEVKQEPVKMAKVKVDGQEFEVLQSEVDEAGGVTSYQKDRAAENRLKKANETLAETRRIQAQMADWIQSQKPKEPVITDDQFIQSKVDAIRFGTPEESAAALREVMQRSNPKIDQHAITQQAVSQMQMLSAVDNFKKEFQDVVSDPMLLRLAAALENDRKPQTGPQTDWAEHYRKIGNEVRSVKGRSSQPAAVLAVPSSNAGASDTPSPVDKEARKASIVNLPTAAARAALPAESKPESREETLNQMRKTRGIPTGG